MPGPGARLEPSACLNAAAALPGRSALEARRRGGAPAPASSRLAGFQELSRVWLKTEMQRKGPLELLPAPACRQPARVDSPLTTSSAFCGTSEDSEARGAGAPGRPVSAHRRDRTRPGFESPRSHERSPQPDGRGGRRALPTGLRQAFPVSVRHGPDPRAGSPPRRRLVLGAISPVDVTVQSRAVRDAHASRPPEPARGSAVCLACG